MFSFPEVNTSQSDSKIQKEGIYVFGGKGENGFPRDSTWLMRIGKSVVTWYELNPVGARPPMRYSHSMCYSEEYGFLAVFGGRTDVAMRSNNYQQILNDLWVLNLEILMWF